MRRNPSVRDPQHTPTIGCLDRIERLAWEDEASVGRTRRRGVVSGRDSMDCQKGEIWRRGPGLCGLG
jgi:hypothetical protein